MTRGRNMVLNQAQKLIKDRPIASVNRTDGYDWTDWNIA